MHIVADVSGRSRRSSPGSTARPSRLSRPVATERRLQAFFLSREAMRRTEVKEVFYG